MPSTIIRQTSVRVVLPTDLTVQATAQGIKFGPSSMITWEWLAAAKEVFHPLKVKPKAARKPKPVKLLSHQ